MSVDFVSDLPDSREFTVPWKPSLAPKEGILPAPNHLWCVVPVQSYLLEPTATLVCSQTRKDHTEHLNQMASKLLDDQ